MAMITLKISLSLSDSPNNLCSHPRSNSPHLNNLYSSSPSQAPTRQKMACAALTQQYTKSRYSLAPNKKCWPTTSAKYNKCRKSDKICPKQIRPHSRPCKSLSFPTVCAHSTSLMMRLPMLLHRQSMSSLRQSRKSASEYKRAAAKVYDPSLSRLTNQMSRYLNLGHLACDLREAR
jgi:hypothetical protein